MAVITSVALGTLATFLLISGNPKAAEYRSTGAMYIENIGLSVLLGVIFALVLPFEKLGMFMCRKIGLKPPGMFFFLIHAFPIAIGNTVMISLIVSLIGVVVARYHIPPEILERSRSLPAMWLSSWLTMIMPLIISSYVLSVVFSPVVSTILGMGDDISVTESGKN